MQYEIYRKFMGHIKIFQLRASYNGENEQSKEYIEFLNKLEVIRNRRLLAMISEENEEKRLYREIMEILEERLKENDEKNVLAIYREIKEKIDFYKIDKEAESDKKEMKKEEIER